jgi:hypothetical protein
VTGIGSVPLLIVELGKEGRGQWTEMQGDRSLLGKKTGPSSSSFKGDRFLAG